ncbi:hypothetical protein E2C01_051179 [Portunus trituberculatus]|uniref:Uncharacterized protein n=1 Tax=Portunus trituberculatus TaxID=210409 RepID=A0A5B7GL22_PORTR|nr:hypothetical protein [Portunus trituberculatus]
MKRSFFSAPILLLPTRQDWSSPENTCRGANAKCEGGRAPLTLTFHLNVEVGTAVANSDLLYSLRFAMHCHQPLPSWCVWW